MAETPEILVGLLRGAAYATLALMLASGYPTLLVVRAFRSRELERRSRRAVIVTAVSVAALVACFANVLAPLALRDAIFERDDRVARALLDFPDALIDVDSRAFGFGSLFMLCMSRNRPDLALELVRRGAELDAVERDGSTARETLRTWAEFEACFGKTDWARVAEAVTARR